MKAAVIVDIEITNIVEYKEYIKLVTPSVLACGGRYLVRGGDPETLDGTWKTSRVVVMEFPSRATAKQWLNDPVLSEVHAMRRKNSSKCNMIVCDMIF